jgi:hypothetical protein
MRRVVLCVAFALFSAAAATQGLAQDWSSVASCPKIAKLPVTFSIDCSQVLKPDQKALCRPFIETVACKVFPAYREITRLKLEANCPSITYRIYDKDRFPHSAGEGGVALRCAVDYVADYSIDFRSKLGPYDVHEILHEYQAMLGALPDAHVLFTSSMAEAIRLIGDQETYSRRLQQMKEESARLHATADSCKTAEVAVEEALYLEDPKTVYAFYRKLKLATGTEHDIAQREARFNRMFYLVSSDRESVRQFLLDRGCGPF